jgi:DNA (cytosine-5)-methyltransferase 1
VTDIRNQPVAYYNENDPKAAAWLRELIKEGHIALGEVDERSIEDVRPDEIRGFTQAHFFAGIGGWSYALRLANWPDTRSVWTGSCPCQFASRAARGRNTATDLWPVFRKLIAASCPPVIFGEQVTHSGWADTVADDLEALGYSFGAAIIPAVSIGADHIRNRLYFVGHSDVRRESSCSINAEASRLPGYRGIPGELLPTDGVSGRVALLRGYGNAIVPQVAAAFIEAASDVIFAKEERLT